MPKEYQTHVRRKKTWLFTLFKQEKIPTRSYSSQHCALTRNPSSLFAPMAEHERRSAINQWVPLPLLSRGGSICHHYSQLHGSQALGCALFGQNIKRNESHSLRQKILALKEGRKREQKAFNGILHVSLTGIER